METSILDRAGCTIVPVNAGSVLLSCRQPALCNSDVITFLSDKSIDDGPIGWNVEWWVGTRPARRTFATEFEVLVAGSHNLGQESGPAELSATIVVLKPEVSPFLGIAALA